MKILIQFFILLIYSFSFGQHVAKFSFDGLTGDSFTIDSVSLKVFPVVNHYNNPERITGVEGNALRFDGHSTWAGHSYFLLNGITDKISIEAWYATEAFSPENASLICQKDNNSGIELSVTPMGEVIFIFVADSSKIVVKTDQRLSPYQWNHIIAFADLPRKTAKIYINGYLWKQLELNDYNLLNLSNSKMFIGRSSDDHYFDGFLLTALNGAVDELSVYNTIPTEQMILEKYQKYAGEVPDLTINAEIRHGADPLRPQYHPMPNTSWANESFGMIFYDNKYHMFFQKNPNFPSLYFMHWGHLSSPDLVQWKEEKIALYPSQEFDKFGIWSGTTIMNNENEPVIYYTGVNGVKAGIGKAIKLDNDLIEWEKATTNPVFPGPPGGYYHMDFRDPFLWNEDGIYYMIVGSGIQNQGGGFLFSFKSNDLENWEILDPIYERKDVERTGIFWEMPSFIKLNDTDYLLCVTPVPAPGEKAQTIYWIGKFQNEKFIPYDKEPENFELVNGNLLSPAFGKDEGGHIFYSGILPESRSVESQKKAGWRHTFSIVRQIRLLDDKKTIGHIPHQNLCRLRDEIQYIEQRKIERGTSFNVPEINGNQMELNFMLDIQNASRFEIHVMKNEDESENTKLIFDVDNSKIGFDRRQSTLFEAEKDLKEASYNFPRNKPLNVHIFLDHSTIEVFIDQLVVFSGRIYPSIQKSNKIDLIVDKGSVVIENLYAWKLKSMGDSMENMVCNPGKLPDSLYTGTQKGASSYHKNDIKVFPVPFNDVLTLQYQMEVAGEVKIDFFSITGRKITSFSPGFKSVGFHQQILYLPELKCIKNQIILVNFKVDGELLNRIKLLKH